MKKPKNIRLFIDSREGFGNLDTTISGKDFEYLTKVMRCQKGDEIYVFNGFDGEFLAEISEIKKKELIIKFLKKTGEILPTQNITLAFALIKNVRIDFIAQKATELGVRSFQPLVTNHSVVDKINPSRFEANIKEAAEQCERNDLPQLFDLKKLSKYLQEDNSNKLFILCDESLANENQKAAPTLLEIKEKNLHKNKEIVILIGPEGGFSSEEFENFAKIKNLHRISLGPRILRADTAIISALTLVQEFLA